MIVPMITDHYEWNYLNTLQDSELVGFPNTGDQRFYARILQHKYSQCQTATLTVATFQVLQSGISAVPVQLTLEQRARQELFDALDLPFQGNLSKERLAENTHR